MIINTELLRTRKTGGFVAIYGTQEDPFSNHYDFMYRGEAKEMADDLRAAAKSIADEAERLDELADSLETPT